MGVLSPISIVSEIVFKSAWNAKVKKYILQIHQHNPFHILFQVKWLTTFVLRLQSACIFLWHSDSLHTLCPALAQALPFLCPPQVLFWEHPQSLLGGSSLLCKDQQMFSLCSCIDFSSKMFAVINYRNTTSVLPFQNQITVAYIYSTLANISFDQ